MGARGYSWGLEGLIVTSVVFVESVRIQHGTFELGGNYEMRGLSNRISYLYMV